MGGRREEGEGGCGRVSPQIVQGTFLPMGLPQQMVKVVNFVVAVLNLCLQTGQLLGQLLSMGMGVLQLCGEGGSSLQEEESEEGREGGREGG